MNFSTSTGLPLAPLPPAADVVDTDAILLRHLMGGEIMTLPNYHLLFFGGEHFVFSIATTFREFYLETRLALQLDFFHSAKSVGQCSEIKFSSIRFYFW